MDKESEMETKLSAIVGASEALSNLAVQKMPALAAYRVQKLIRACKAEYETYSKVRNDLIQKYGVEREKEPGFYDVPDENKAEYTRETKELLDMNVEIAVSPIKLSELKDVNISPVDLTILEFALELDI
jgi:hypothetical protein